MVELTTLKRYDSHFQTGQILIRPGRAVAQGTSELRIKIIILRYRKSFATMSVLPYIAALFHEFHNGFVRKQPYAYVHQGKVGRHQARLFVC